MIDTTTEPADTAIGTAAEGYTDPPPTTVAADVVLFGVDDQGRLRVLTIRRLWEPHAGRRALPGGLLEEKEDLAAAAVRELGEECGIHVLAEDLTEIGSSSDPDRDPRRRVLSVAFGAVLPDCPVPTAGDDASEARWMLAEAIIDDPESVAFDHHQIVVRARKQLAEQIMRVAPGALPALDRVQDAVRAFTAVLGSVDREALATELKQVRKSQLHELVGGLDGALSKISDVLGDCGETVGDFLSSTDELEAASEALAEVGTHLENVVHELRP
ncbi:hypothetical protein GCM10027258_81370 [Amycolatopsis stemonae]